MSTQAFLPRGQTVCLAVTASQHAAVQVPGTPSGAYTYEVVNAGTKTAFIATSANGTDTQGLAAVPADGNPAWGRAILSGEICTFNAQVDAFFTAICGGSDSTTLYITPGEGL